MNQYGPFEKRLLGRFIVTPGCWLWVGKRSDRGYGKIKNRGRMLSAHVAVYEHYCGPVPKGKELDHLCRVHHCVNPNHLEPVTHKVNCQRGKAGKHLGERTHCKNGHPFDTDNTGVRKGSGGRRCRQCAVAATMRYLKKTGRIK